MRLQGPVPWKKDSTTGSESHESRDVPTEELLPTDLGIVRHYYSTALHCMMFGKKRKEFGSAGRSRSRRTHIQAPAEWSTTSQVGASRRRVSIGSLTIRAESATHARLHASCQSSSWHHITIHPSIHPCGCVNVCLCACLPTLSCVLNRTVTTNHDGIGRAMDETYCTMYTRENRWVQVENPTRLPTVPRRGTQSH
jgi:hypothetical protein